MINSIARLSYTTEGAAAQPTVSSQKRSRSNLLCCLLSVISQRPPRLFLSSSHMGSMPSCSNGSDCQHTSQTTAPKLQKTAFKSGVSARFQHRLQDIHPFQLFNILSEDALNLVKRLQLEY